MDRTTGGAMGIASIKFETHEQAHSCQRKEDGKKFGAGRGSLIAGVTGDEEMRVVFDEDGSKMKTVLKELEDRKRKEKEEKRRKDIGIDNTVAASGGQSAHSAIPSPTKIPPSVSATPNSNSWRPSPAQPQPQINGNRPFPPRPQGFDPTLLRSAQAGPSIISTMVPQPLLISPERFLRAPISMTRARPVLPASLPSEARIWPEEASGSSTPLDKSVPRQESHRRGERWIDVRSRQELPQANFYRPPLRLGGDSASHSPGSRSPSVPDSSHWSRVGLRPLSPTSPGRRRDERPRSRELLQERQVLELLVNNGHEHIRIDGSQLGGASVQEEDVRAFVDGLRADKASCVLIVEYRHNANQRLDP